jgi:hypothetical protein
MGYSVGIRPKSKIHKDKMLAFMEANYRLPTVVVNPAHLEIIGRAKNPDRGYQIANNHGHVNGWTRTIYGKVTL